VEDGTMISVEKKRKGGLGKRTGVSGERSRRDFLHMGWMAPVIAAIALSQPGRAFASTGGGNLKQPSPAQPYR